MKYKELEGVFLPKDIEEDKGWLSVAVKGKISWCTRLDPADLSEYSWIQWEKHFDKYHDNLGLPVEFIT